jgi:chromosome segregation ATPase
MLQYGQLNATLEAKSKDVELLRDSIAQLDLKVKECEKTIHDNEQKHFDAAEALRKRLHESEEKLSKEIAGREVDKQNHHSELAVISDRHENMINTVSKRLQVAEEKLNTETNLRTTCEQRLCDCSNELTNRIDAIGQVVCLISVLLFVAETMSCSFPGNFRASSKREIICYSLKRA